MKAIHLTIIMAALLLGCRPSTVMKTKSITREVKGIDVSHHQGNIDWKAVSENGIDYVYIKATQGMTFTDDMYEKNRKLARQSGLLVGAYHFYSMQSKPKDQFENFRKACPKGTTDLIPMIDVEFAGKLSSAQLAELGDGAKELADLMEQYYGKKPMIYCSPDVYNWCIYGRFSNDYMLMLGHPYTTYPAIKGKKHYDIWQYTYSGRINGVKQSFDMHKFHKDTSLDMITL